MADGTRRRILEAARRLGYQPNLLASGLRGGATRSIGVIVKGLSVPITASHMRRLIHIAQGQGYFTYTLNIDHPGDDSAIVERMARDLIGRRVDGLVICRSLPLSARVRRFLDQCPVPVVYMGGWGPARSVRRVVLDVVPSMKALATHLAALGHRQVAYFPSLGQRDFPEAKLLPMRRAMASAGITLRLNPSWWIDTSGSQVAQAAHEVTRAFLADRPTGVTALVVVNDVGAMGTLAALWQAGVRVPLDMSVVGFDDMDGACFTDPALTTIRAADERPICQAVFDKLQALMADPQATLERSVFPFQLIVRDSTGPARMG